MATCLSSQEPFNDKERDMQDIAREAWTNSFMTFFYRLQHMDASALSDQKEISSNLVGHWM